MAEKAEKVRVTNPLRLSVRTWAVVIIAEELLPTAVRVLPALESAGLARSWVGLYEMTPDRHAILGPVEGLGGLHLAVGFSGHGFQHAPIVGEVLAQGRLAEATEAFLRNNDVPWPAPASELVHGHALVDAFLDQL